MNRILAVDFAVIGSGLAGSATAHLLSAAGDVALLSKGLPTGSNSHTAQGGIAAAIGPDDAPDLHAKDTLDAGDGLCDAGAVRRLVARAPQMVDWLTTVGVVFDEDAAGRMAFGLEGAHSRARILHAGGDATGAHLLAPLTEAIDRNPRVERIVAGEVRALLRTSAGVCGALVDDGAGNRLFILARRGTILATGGVGQLYAHTTNPAGATGDGVALAYEAGAVIRNLEFIQFHPTALRQSSHPQFLISEAVRGAGAQLVDGAGRPILADHPQGSLAPRDVVARRMDEVRRGGGEVFLDARRVEEFVERFPTIYAACRAAGADPRADLLPVSPAAHFSMGGVRTGLAGETTVAGLSAVGEVASTGVHGANRLASNSLLECLVMAHELADRLRAQDTRFAADGLDMEEAARSGFAAIDGKVMDELRTVMWECAGIVRDGDGLRDGLRRLRQLAHQAPRAAPLLTARLIVESALWREESRGAHYRTDFPEHSAHFASCDTLVDKRAWLTASLR